MAFSLPPLPNAQLFDERAYPTAPMQVYWQQLTGYLASTIDTLANVTGTVLPGYQTAITAAQTAATAANMAAATANAAAAALAAANAKEQALVNSYIDPASVLTATTTTITIASHTRHYADGTSVSVNGGTVTAVASPDGDYVSYDDPTRAGGTVTYVVSTTQPPQTGSTHVVGAVNIPTTGTANGGVGPRKPGFVDPDPAA